jgi:hypothetical protein
MLEGDDSWRNKDMHVWYVLVDKMTNKVGMIVPATPYFLDGPFEDYKVLCQPRSYTPRKFLGTKEQIKSLFGLK